MSFEVLNIKPIGVIRHINKHSFLDNRESEVLLSLQVIRNKEKRIILCAFDKVLFSEKDFLSPIKINLEVYKHYINLQYPLTSNMRVRIKNQLKDNIDFCFNKQLFITDHTLKTWIDFMSKVYNYNNGNGPSIEDTERMKIQYQESFLTEVELKTVWSFILEYIKNHTNSEKNIIHENIKIALKNETKEDVESDISYVMDNCHVVDIYTPFEGDSND